MTSSIANALAPRTAAVLVIGEEILSGKTDETNAAFLIRELRDLGVALRRIMVVGDVREEIALAVRDLSARFDYVFTSGGVGPTHDDITMESIAHAFGCSVRRHPELELRLRQYYGERLHERSLRMADVPEGADLVSGEDIVWPVVVMKNVHILPGVPEIFRRKFRAIRARFSSAPFHLRQIFVKADESVIAAFLDEVVLQFPAVSIGSYPRFYHPHDAPDWKVKVTIESRNEEEVGRVHEMLTTLLAEWIAEGARP